MSINAGEMRSRLTILQKVNAPSTLEAPFPQLTESKVRHDISDPKLPNPVIMSHFISDAPKMQTKPIDKKPTVFILVGPPGSGKGAISKRLSRKFDLPHISTGDLFRKHLQSNTEIGRKAKNYINTVTLVPDEIVMEMVTSHIAELDTHEGYILDGFPRTLAQAKAVEKMLNDKANIYVVHLDIDDAVSIQRVIKRHQDREKRKDDTVEVTKQRLAIYHRESKPLLEYYQQAGLLTAKVTEKPSANAVYAEVMSAYLNQREAEQRKTAPTILR